MSTLQDFEIDAIQGGGNVIPELEGKVVLAVNVASKCGLTPHYEGLESLYEGNRDRGLVVVGFPCNQFGGQEPGTEDEIVDFCTTNYGVKFPMTTKIDVNGRRWHRTGDAGYFDAEGRLWLVGRCGAAICDRRGTLYPFQIEYAVLGIPGMQRAALVECYGQRVLAIESRRAQTVIVESLPAAVRRRIDRVVTVRRLPTDRRHDSKIDY